MCLKSDILAYLWYSNRCMTYQQQDVGILKVQSMLREEKLFCYSGRSTPFKISDISLKQYTVISLSIQISIYARLETERQV